MNEMIQVDCVRITLSPRRLKSETRAMQVLGRTKEHGLPKPSSNFISQMEGGLQRNLRRRRQYHRACPRGDGIFTVTV